MNNSSVGILAFVAGAAIGSVVTWRILKTRYEQIVKEEIESVKEAFSTLKVDEATDESEDTSASDFRQDHKEYCDMVAESGYTNGEKGGTELMDGIKPYVIPPEEYGEHENYETVSFTYYADGVVAFEYVDPKTGELLFDIMEDIDLTIGYDSLKRFGEYEPDAVHVRNDRLECDYEILRDFKKFSEVSSSSFAANPVPEDE